MKNRNINLDYIRAFALIFVVSIHSFLHIDYYSQPNEGMLMLLLSCLRILLNTCVPLFLILSGFLQVSKIPTKEYYLKFIYIYLIYIACGMGCQIYIFVFQNESFKLRESMISFISFRASPYGWYVGMYFGLYLIIPFINLLLKELSNKQVLVLLGSLIIITILPSLFNNMDLENIKWWQGTKDHYFMVVDDFWTGFYPVTFYIIGYVINKNREKIIEKRYLYYVLVPIQMILYGIYNYARNYGSQFPWTTECTYNGYQSLLMSTCVFCMIISVNLKNNGFSASVVKFLAKHSLSIYLLSYASDSAVYHISGRIVNSFCYRAYTIPITVFLSIVIASIPSVIVVKLAAYLYAKFQNKFCC
ncbi:MAG: acyltransferase [Lachnospiraceae bacterium]|nr:acyltransferase [Lachnospiraceae bacterium]